MIIFTFTCHANDQVELITEYIFQVDDLFNEQATSSMHVSAFISSITTTFPLPPSSPHLTSDRRLSSSPCLPLPFPCQTSPTPSVGQSSTALQLPRSTLSPPASPSSLSVVDPEASPALRFNSISPVPSRRESQYDYELTNTLPVPNEFADPRASLKEPPIEILRNIDEDIEVRILSSTDNLMDVGDDEPYLFEQKSLSDIRDSLTTSLDTSIDIDEIENESAAEDEGKECKRSDPDGGNGESSTKDEDEEKEDKTEKDSGDSEGTDDTVREKVGSGAGTDSDETKDEEEHDSKDDSEITTEDTDTKELAETTVSEQTTTLETPLETDLDLSESDGGDPALKHVRGTSRLSEHDTLEEELKQAIKQESLDDENDAQLKEALEREKLDRENGNIEVEPSDNAAEKAEVEPKEIPDAADQAKELKKEKPEKDTKEEAENVAIDSQLKVETTLSVPKTETRPTTPVGVLETDIDDIPHFFPARVQKPSHVSLKLEDTTDSSTSKSKLKPFLESTVKSTLYSRVRRMSKGEESTSELRSPPSYFHRASVPCTPRSSILKECTFALPPGLDQDLPLLPAERIVEGAESVPEDEKPRSSLSE